MSINSESFSITPSEEASSRSMSTITHFKHLGNTTSQMNLARFVHNSELVTPTVLISFNSWPKIEMVCFFMVGLKSWPRHCITASRSPSRRGAFVGEPSTCRPRPWVARCSTTLRNDRAAASRATGRWVGTAAAAAAKSPVAVQGTKVNLLYARDRGVAEGLRHNALWNAAAMQTGDISKAVSALLLKQHEDPDFEDI
uniref:Uncharacterized protein n=1 Tax=Heterosigma akashiwo TaxID=2829 RepID=A0A6V1PPJ5_HETAK